jgi:hypothetical protein
MIVRHVAGPYDAARDVQRCARCGIVLKDNRASRARDAYAGPWTDEQTCWTGPRRWPKRPMPDRSTSPDRITSPYPVGAAVDREDGPVPWQAMALTAKADWNCAKPD